MTPGQGIGVVQCSQLQFKEVKPVTCVILTSPHPCPVGTSDAYCSEKHDLECDAEKGNDRGLTVDYAPTKCWGRSVDH